MLRTASQEQTRVMLGLKSLRGQSDSGIQCGRAFMGATIDGGTIFKVGGLDF